MDEEEEHIYFTLQGSNMIGRLTIEDRKVDLVPSPVERSRPYGIKIGPDGVIWVVLLGTNKIVGMDPETMELRTFDLPREEARPRRIEVTADGRVWYVDYAKGYLGAYDPEADDFEEWQMPQGEDARPYGTASDASGRIWAVATGVQPNIFMGFDPETEEWFSATPVPSGGGTIRHMHYHEPTGSVWFGADTNYIGRAIVEPESDS
jgi:virginiamycin B lyase